MKKIFTAVLPLVFAMFLCLSVSVCASQADLALAERDRAESRPMGDVNGDGKVSAADARKIMRASVALENLPGEAIPYADCDGNGKIALADARFALRVGAQLEAAPDRHDFGVDILTEPTCTDKGKLSFECKFCGLTGEAVVPANGHDYVDVVDKIATCTEDGQTTRTCNVCKTVIVVTTKSSDHKWTVNKTNGSVVCDACKSKCSGWIDIGGATYHCMNGVADYSWCKVDNSYYFFDRSTRVLKKNCTVDGLKLAADGKAPTDSYSVEKIKTFIKAKNIVASITSPGDSVADKKLKCFKWVMTKPYKQYHLVGKSMKTKGFEMLFANDIFDKGAGCCGSTSYAFAFLAVECGCKAVYVCDDGVATDGHAWVTMEGNNRVYDVIFAKSKSFSGNYDASVSDYRKYQPRKTYVGG